MKDDLLLRTYAKLSDLDRIRHLVEEKVRTFGVAPADVHDILLSITEAATNILVHGYQGKPGFLEIDVRKEGNAVAVCLRDEAPHFDPSQAPAPDLISPLEKRPLGGLGIYLMRQFTDQLLYRAIPQGGNELTLIKHIVIPDLFQEHLDEDRYDRS